MSIHGKGNDIGRGFGGPARYIQAPGVLNSLPDHIARFGQNALVVIDAFILDTFGTQLKSAMSTAGLAVRFEKFGGECSADEIDRLSKIASSHSYETVVGIGGGKVIDTAKCVAAETQSAMIVVPTVASTDAPCSAIAVRYTTDGQLDTGLFLKRNPDLVLVDSQVIVNAPIRFLVSGMGDALSTWYEARSNKEAGLSNFVGDRHPPTLAGLAIARQCHEAVFEHGLKAKADAEQKSLTPSVEAIIEANTLLSGIGFENCGVSAAHGISDALGVLDPEHKFLHGEKVAFGILCLLEMEGRPAEEFEEAAQFLHAVGLPTRLADFDLADCPFADIQKIAKAALSDGASTWRTSLELSTDMVCDAILSADLQASSLGHGPAWNGKR